MERHEIERPRSSVDSKLGEIGRRRFLKMAAATGITLPWGAAVTHAQVVRNALPAPLVQPVWQIEAVRVEQSFLDGSTAPFYRYRALDSTPVAGTVPVLTGAPGELIRVRLRNSLPVAIRPAIVGGASGPLISPGVTATFKLRMPPEGTWLLTEETLGDAAGPMGLGAVIISRPAGAGRRKSSGYDREYVLLYIDSDDRWNTAIDSGGTPDYDSYEPNYHTVNNLSYPHTTTDPGTTISCQVGERVLLRLGNLGWVRQAIHFHGYHVEIERMNNQPQTIYGPKDTIPLPAHTTAEIVLPVNQPGVYPVHPHSLTTTTDNGLYIGGQVTLIVAS